jgi:hypothetical protein
MTPMTTLVAIRAAPPTAQNAPSVSAAAIYVASFRWRAIWGMIFLSARGCGGARESNYGEFQGCPLCERDHPDMRAVVSGLILELSPGGRTHGGARGVGSTTPPSTAGS